MSIDLDQIKNTAQIDIRNSLLIAILNDLPLESINELIFELEEQNFDFDFMKTLIEHKKEFILEVILKFKYIRNTNLAILCINQFLSSEIVLNLIDEPRESIPILLEHLYDNYTSGTYYYDVLIKKIHERYYSYISIDYYFENELNQPKLLKLLVRLGAKCGKTCWAQQMNEDKIEMKPKEFKYLVKSMLNHIDPPNFDFEELYEFRKNIFDHCKPKLILKFTKILRTHEKFDYYRIFKDSMNHTPETLKLLSKHL